MCTMAQRSFASHQICISAPLAQCHRFFTPAGEELWVEGWKPDYKVPSDGRTEPGMVFTTGSGEDFTIWTMVDFDTQACYSRYARVTPALRAGFVEVRCTAVNDQTTLVDVSYTLTALTEAGERSLQAFEGAEFTAMIEDWRKAVQKHLPKLLSAEIR